MISPEHQKTTQKGSTTRQHQRVQRSKLMELAYLPLLDVVIFSLHSRMMKNIPHGQALVEYETLGAEA